MKKAFNYFKRWFKLIPINIHLKKAKKRGLTIGKNFEIYSRIDFGSEPYLITIGDNVRLSIGCMFVTHDGGTWVLNNLDGGRRDVFGKIKIGNNVHIGPYSIIMPGVTIGDNVVIGSFSLITKSIPSNTVAFGSPAKVYESVEEYKQKVGQKCVNTKGMSFKNKRQFLKDHFKL